MHSDSVPIDRFAPRLWLAALLALSALTSMGCTRAYYRQQADNEAYELLANGQRDPRWQLGRYTIDVDPRSRFYDPNCPDYSPMPPDDPVSHQLMHCVDCKEGWPCWHRNGDTPFVANPLFENYLAYDNEGYVVLNREGSVQLALLHSNGYQNNLETLYLSAIDVTQERFAFDTQFFAGNQTFFTALGRAAPGAGGRSRSTLRTDTDFTARRLFAGGGELVASVANSFVWQFAGPNTETVNTILDATFIQPLLRQAGRDVVLEALTVQERRLLANIRAMHRYRQGFYVQIVTGQNAPQGPQRGGGGLGGTAAGLFGVAGLTTGGGGGGQGGQNANIGGAGAGAAQAGGYLGLLQDARQIENLRSNVAGLRRSLQLLEALFESNRIDRLQVDLARQQLYRSQSQLIIAEAGYQSSLDNFKLSLGLPPSLNVKIDDPLLDQFELLGPEMVALQNDSGTMLARLAAPANGGAIPPEVQERQQQVDRDLQSLRDATELLRLAQALVPVGPNPLQDLRDRFRVYEARLLELQDHAALLRRTVDQLRTYPGAIEAAKDLQAAAQEQLPAVESSLEEMRTRSDERIDDLERLSQREEVQRGTVDVRAFDVEAFRERLERLPADYSQIDRRLSAPLERWDNRLREVEQQQAAVDSLVDRFSQIIAPLIGAAEQLKRELDQPGVLALPPQAQQFRDELDRLAADPARDLERFAADLQRIRDLLDSIFQEANVLAQDASSVGLVQARARLEATRLISIDMEPAKAFLIALQNRLDLMNARASLVDAWRLIQFRADALQSDLEVEFGGSLGTLGDNPFRFRSPTGTLRAGLRFDSPITRLVERNVYRQELVNYQRARRNFINFNDQMDRGLRNILRTIELNQLNFELRRTAVEVAIEQVELASLRLQEPPRPGVVTEGFGGTTARDLVDSLAALLQAQNDYLSVFVNYEQQRMVLDLELGTMMLDPQGLWVDPGPVDESKYDGCETDEDKAPEPPELVPPSLQTDEAPGPVGTGSDEVPLNAPQGETGPPPAPRGAGLENRSDRDVQETNERTEELPEPLRLSPVPLESSSDASGGQSGGLKPIPRPSLTETPGWKRATPGVKR
jgi:outer membrane protein TolC